MNSKEDRNTAGERLREWFADVKLEDSIELSSLHQYVSNITIDVPKNNDDADLRDLVRCANEQPKTSSEGRGNLEKLGAYLEKMKQREADERKEASNKASEAEERRKEKHEKRGKLSRKVYAAFKGLAAPVTTLFDFVSRVLRRGMAVLESTSFLAAELTFQTHYQVAVKAIMLFITAYEGANELSENIVKMFEKIGEYEHEMKALWENIRSVPMLRAINKLFVSIVAFITGVGSYMKHGTLSKMIKFLGGGNEKLEELLNAVMDDYAQVTRVMNFAHSMISISSHEKLTTIEENAARFMQQLSLLNDSFAHEMSKQLRAVQDHSSFQAELHVQGLRAELFDELHDPSEEMAFNDSERVFLSPQDRWPRRLRGFGGAPEDNDNNNEAAAPAGPPSTPSTAARPLTWISGGAARRNVSWVSSFSVDLITHSREFSNFDAAYVFCKRGRGARYTPTPLLKSLAMQILEAHPPLATRNLRRLSRNRFHDVGARRPYPDSAETTIDHSEADVDTDSGDLAWQLFEDVLRLFAAAPDLRGRVALILIDRLDLCQSEPGFSVLEDLIPRLQGLGSRIARVQVLITTARLSPHAVPTLRRGSEWLRAFGKKTHG